MVILLPENLLHQDDHEVDKSFKADPEPFDAKGQYILGCLCRDSFKFWIL